VWQSERSDWGDTLGKQLLVRTQVLAWEHLYPMEKRLIEIVQKELAEGRRSMVYFEQNDLRSMARRLEWVLKDYKPWTLPNSVEAEDRQQARYTRGYCHDCARVRCRVCAPTEPLSPISDDRDLATCDNIPRCRRRHRRSSLHNAGHPDQ
jgi:hypothetical protein